VNPALRASAAHVFVESLEAPELRPEDAHHLFRVLRLRDGETVTVSDGDGGWRPTVVEGPALLPSGPIVREERTPAPVIASAIPKGDRVDWMVQKLTEVGVQRILFLHCDRSVVRWDGERAARQLARLQKVAREAAMQSRRTELPEIAGPVPFATVAAWPGAVLAEPDGSDIAALAAAPSVLVVGPEGGFSGPELALGTPQVRFSSQVLRVETAALVGAIRFLT
jgi:16S rRNA (uracil1498-N3)-methyltransferase